MEMISCHVLQRDWAQDVALNRVDGAIIEERSESDFTRL